MSQSFKLKARLPIAALVTVGIVGAATASEAQQLRTFKYNRETYTVRAINSAGRERVIEIGINGATESGDRSMTAYRQYSGSCSGSQFSFLGEHSTDRNGVVRFANPQPPGTIIKASEGAGQVVKRGFAIVCGR